MLTIQLPKNLLEIDPQAIADNAHTCTPEQAVVLYQAFARGLESGVQTTFHAEKLLSALLCSRKDDAVLAGQLLNSLRDGHAETAVGLAAEMLSPQSPPGPAVAQICQQVLRFAMAMEDMPVRISAMDKAMGVLRKGGAGLTEKQRDDLFIYMFVAAKEGDVRTQQAMCLAVDEFLISPGKAALTEKQKQICTYFLQDCITGSPASDIATVITYGLILNKSVAAEADKPWHATLLHGLALAMNHRQEDIAIPAVEFAKELIPVLPQAQRLPLQAGILQLAANSFMPGYQRVTKEDISTLGGPFLQAANGYRPVIFGGKREETYKMRLTTPMC